MIFSLWILFCSHGHCPCIANKGSDKEVTLSEGSYVCGFGPGAFKLVKVDDALTGKQIEFKLADHNQRVVLNNQVLTLGTVLAAQRKQKADAQIVYHKITLDANKPQEFTLASTHRVTFQMKDMPAENTIHNVAQKEPVNHWTNQATEVLWAVRWTQKGLMPVRPAVHLKAPLVLPPGHACKLGKDASESQPAEGANPASDAVA